MKGGFDYNSPFQNTQMNGKLLKCFFFSHNDKIKQDFCNINYCNLFSHVKKIHIVDIFSYANWFLFLMFIDTDYFFLRGVYFSCN